jgi:hypothetical protein
MLDPQRLKKAASSLSTATPPQRNTLQSPESMASIPDLVRQKIREILELYPVPDVEDVAFKQSIFEIFKAGSKAQRSPSS